MFEREGKSKMLFKGDLLVVFGMLYGFSIEKDLLPIAQKDGEKRARNIPESGWKEGKIGKK